MTYNVESNIDEIELVDFLIDFSKDLNKDEQELFSLIIEGYSFSEISKKMNAPLKTVYYIFSTFKEKIGVINSSK